VTCIDAKGVRKRYKGLVFCRVDKNNKQWVVQCEDMYVKKVLDTYCTVQDGGKNYKLLQKTEKEVKMDIERGYTLLTVAREWCTNKQWKMAEAYILNKNKDLNKCRPLVSFCGFIHSRVGRFIARGLTVVIRLRQERPKLKSRR
jgi:hypothetical protein